MVACTDQTFGYEVFNLGECRTVWLDDLIELLKWTLGKPALMDRQPLQSRDVPVSYADSSKERRLLGYGPQTKIAQGIPKLVAWFRGARSGAQDA